jgi:putative transposase
VTIQVPTLRRYGDFAYLLIDPMIVRAHQPAAGAKKGGLKIKPSAVPEA